MSFELKRSQALEVLSKTGIWRSNYEPPIVRLLWRFGLKVPPPHFAPFLSTALLAGVFFGACWGGVMWLILWSHSGTSPLLGAKISCLAGAAFGIAMAFYYAYGKIKYKLPRWNSLGRDVPCS
jgi:hypothetical protein